MSSNLSLGATEADGKKSRSKNIYLTLETGATYNYANVGKSNLPIKQILLSDRFY